MRIQILLICFLGISYHLSAQENVSVEVETVGDSIYKQEVVDEPAEFPGGMSAMRTFVVNNLKYPSDAMQKNIQGKVFIEFVIEKNGKLSNIKVRRGVYESLDKEAVRVIQIMPDWKPAQHQGQVVRQLYIFPFNFKNN